MVYLNNLKEIYSELDNKLVDKWNDKKAKELSNQY